MSVRSPEFWQGESTVVPSTLRGYRTWRVTDLVDGGVRLASTAMPHVWAKPAVVAVCLQETPVGPVVPGCPCVFCAEPLHDPPTDGCACGIYGWYDPGDSRLVTGDVFGAIEVSGRVVLATHGFRAEKARVVAVAIEPPRMGSQLAYSLGMDRGAGREQLHALAQWCAAEGVPVFATREELISAFPSEDVSGLVEHECGEGCVAARRYTIGGAVPPAVAVHAAVAAAGLTSAMRAAPGANAAYAAAVEPARSGTSWKRRLLVALCVLAALVSLAGVAASCIRLTQTTGPGQTALSSGLLAINTLGVILAIRLTRQAWRWGR
jgi:hypothetical protein